MHIPEQNRDLTSGIKLKATRLGFDLCGIAPVRRLVEHESVLKNWCSAGMNGTMSFMENNLDKRINPDLLFPGAKSVIVTGLNYYSQKKQTSENVPIISKYAYGQDYHDIIIKKLDDLLEAIRQLDPNVNGKSFVDGAPLLEKAWAREAGLGWIGKHSILINKEIGSFFFIGILLVDINLDYDTPFTSDYCGECTACIDICPTRAINSNHTIDARKCIAYHTIESKEDIPSEISVKAGKSVFGCDKCQDICPWNKNAKPNHIPEFELSSKIETMTAEDWMCLTKAQFAELFKKSPVRRRKYDRFMRNLMIINEI